MEYCYFKKSSYSNYRENGISKSLNEEIIIEAFFFIVALINEGGFPSLPFPSLSQSLKGFAKMKFDKQHRAVLDALPKEQERLFKTISKGEKITPKAWQKEIYKILGEQFPIEDKMSADVHFTHIKFALNRLFANCFGCGMMLLLM